MKKIFVILITKNIDFSNYNIKIILYLSIFNI